MDLSAPENSELMAEFLIIDVCPDMPDADICETWVLTWWAKVAAILFNEHTAGHMCNAINPECDNPPETR